MKKVGASTIAKVIYSKKSAVRSGHSGHCGLSKTANSRLRFMLYGIGFVLFCGELLVGHDTNFGWQSKTLMFDTQRLR